MAEATRLFDALDYDRVVPLAEAVLASPGATIEQRLDAYLLQGSSLAIVGDAVAAEKPFRFLLRGRPDYDMAPTTPPKILATFRKVQVEERAIRDQLHELERAQIIKSISLQGAPPSEMPGGLPIHFDYRLQDPRGAVAELKVQYKKRGTPSFSSLALAPDAAGHWLGELPGEWTENDSGLVVDYYLTTADARGETLLELGGPGSLLRIDVTPGTVASARPLYRSPWFWGASAGVVVALSAAAYFAYSAATALPNSDLGSHPIR